MKYLQCSEIASSAVGVIASASLIWLGATTGGALHLLGGGLGILWSSWKLNSICKKPKQKFVPEEKDVTKQEFSIHLTEKFSEVINHYLLKLGKGNKNLNMRLKDHLENAVHQVYAEAALTDNNPEATSYELRQVTLELVEQYKSYGNVKDLPVREAQRQAQQELASELAHWTTESVYERRAFQTR